MKKSVLYVSILFGFILLFDSCEKENNDPNNNNNNTETITLLVKVTDDKGAAVAGANVRLFDDEQNWSDDKNPCKGNTPTDANGFATFTDLNAIEYYFIAEKGGLNNWFENSDTGGALVKGQTKTVSTVIR
jgi:hypothetical protein